MRFITYAIGRFPVLILWTPTAILLVVTAVKRLNRVDQRRIARRDSLRGVRRLS